MFDLPIGMEAMGFKYAAYFARRWFNGKAHIIDDKQKNDPAVIQPEEFVDKDTLKLDWILKFGKVRARYSHLLTRGLSANDVENIYNEKSLKEIVKLLRQFIIQNNKSYSHTLDTLTESGNDLQALDRRFQFQHVGVSVFDVLGGYTTMMNDLAATLANFNFYAAIATVKISVSEYYRYDKKPWQHCIQSRAEITHIYVYAKDTYSFNDDPKSSVSQYLGHWNRRGVIIALDAAVADIFKFSEPSNKPRQYLPELPAHLDKPVDAGSKLEAKEVFYPVRNRHFRQWREIKGHGGDLVIYSTIERIKLPKPIVLELGEICKEYTH